MVDEMSDLYKFGINFRYLLFFLKSFHHNEHNANIYYFIVCALLAVSLLRFFVFLSHSYEKNETKNELPHVRFLLIVI